MGMVILREVQQAIIQTKSRGGTDLLMAVKRVMVLDCEFNPTGKRTRKKLGWPMPLKMSL